MFHHRKLSVSSMIDPKKNSVKLETFCKFGLPLRSVAALTSCGYVIHLSRALVRHAREEICDRLKTLAGTRFSSSLLVRLVRKICKTQTLF